MAAGSNHNRVDSYASMVTLLAIAIPRYIPAASGSDEICGLLVSIMVIKSGLEAVQIGIAILLQSESDGDTPQSSGTRGVSVG